MSRGPIPDFPRDRPTVPEVQALVDKLYRDHPAGGNMHIVLDDGNLRPSDIEFCLRRAREADDALCIEIAEKMLLMTPTQRRRL